MNKSLETNRSRAGSPRWLAVIAGTHTGDRTNYRAARLSFRRQFESAPVAMVLANGQGRIILVNAQTDHLFGYDREELIGMQLEVLIPERFRDGHLGHLAANFAEPCSQPIDVDLHLYGLSKDGSEFPVEISLSKVESDEGTLISAAIRDVSERKQIDELQQKLQAAYSEISVLTGRLEQENVYVQPEIKLAHSHTAVVGQSQAIRDVLKKAEQVAPVESAVLLLGETGTGKELIARTIHELSSRKARPMVKVNCAAMPATLIESELFGREKGAYTGALSREIGRFELADHSTIFLDEIGEMPIELQAKLLRVLQDGEFERLGSPRTLHVDVRVIAATNRDLQAAVKEGKFREDLYYRLSVFPIQIPPLRKRREDIAALVWHLLTEHCTRMGKDVKSIHHATLKAFQQYSWPGNVRELSNLIERYLILNPGPVFRAEVPELGETRAPAGQQLDEVERLHILQVLRSTRFRIRGNGGAAEHLGLKPTTLEARMKKLGIVRPQWSIPGSIPLTDHMAGISPD